MVDAYVVVVGLDSDPIFGREAREAGKVLSRRYNAVGHTIVLAGTEGSGPSALPNGSPRNLAVALARVAELMDKKQDVLVLYTAGHGAKVGLAYHDGDDGFGIIPPGRMARLFDELGIKNRLLILSACFSGIFVPTLSSDTTALFTAASADRTSFGCQSDKDWTFYGDAMINNALRQPVPLAKAGEDARALITKWEAMGNITPSQPQIAIGSKVATWLDAARSAHAQDRDADGRAAGDHDLRRAEISVAKPPQRRRCQSRDERLPAADPPGARTRQLYLTVFIVLLALWIARDFLTPIAWAVVLAMAEWPLYARARAALSQPVGMARAGLHARDRACS